MRPLAAKKMVIGVHFCGQTPNAGSMYVSQGTPRNEHTSLKCDSHSARTGLSQLKGTTQPPIVNILNTLHSLLPYSEAFFLCLKLPPDRDLTKIFLAMHEIA